MSDTATKHATIAKSNLTTIFATDENPVIPANYTTFETTYKTAYKTAFCTPFTTTDFNTQSSTITAAINSTLLETFQATKLSTDEISLPAAKFTTINTTIYTTKQ
jgi:hypothetical protein